jgi:ribA/ribD-fused uncharacterized protein
MTPKIIFYSVRGEHGFLSNFYYSPSMIDGVMYDTVEHFFQSQKFLCERTQKFIRCLNTPRDAAIQGRRKTLPLRPDWEEVKDDIMRIGIYNKFTQDRNLWEKLASTGTQELIERSEKDAYWGDGGGKGKNMLGQMLMDLRTELSGRKDEMQFCFFQGKVMQVPYFKVCHWRRFMHEKLRYNPLRRAYRTSCYPGVLPGSEFFEEFIAILEQFLEKNYSNTKLYKTLESRYDSFQGLNLSNETRIILSQNGFRNYPICEPVTATCAYCGHMYYDFTPIENMKKEHSLLFQCPYAKILWDL